MGTPDALAPNLSPVAGLLGRWSGSGRGFYPTIDSFTYTEEVCFTNIGKPFLHYEQRTWAEDGRALHVETGYLRVPSEGMVEFVLAQPTGQTELCEGTLLSESESLLLELSATVVCSETAKTVDSTSRRYQLSGGTLSCSFAMAAVGQPLSGHLESTLVRAD